MAAFFCEVWEHILTPDFLNRVRQKYHFEEADWIELRTVAGPAHANHPGQYMNASL